MVNAAPLPFEQAYDHLTSNSKQRKVTIIQREAAGDDLIKKAQALGKELFAQQGAGGEESLFNVFKERLTSWDSDLARYEPLAKTGNYPGLTEIEKCRDSLMKFVKEGDSLRFLKRFVEHKDELQEISDDISELQDFYINQKRSWEGLRATVEGLSQNRLQLEAHDEAGPALVRMEEILGTPRPYALLHEVADITHTARSVNDKLLIKACGPAMEEIQKKLDDIVGELNGGPATDELRKETTEELTKLLANVTEATSIAHIAQARHTADEAFDRALTAIEKAQAPVRPDDPTPTPRVKKRCVVEAKALWPGGFIETPEDVEAFLKKLREELEAALKADERIQLK